jgi:hypothetical protein
VTLTLLLTVLTVQAANAYVTGRVTLNGRGVTDAVVLVRSGLPRGAKYQAPTSPVTVTVRGCRFTPSIVALMPGQALEIRNADAEPRRITSAGRRNPPFDVVVAAKRSTRRYLATPEIPVRLRCDGRAANAGAVAVLGHPYFAVTGAVGEYALAPLPPGTYVLEAWHGRYGTRSATVTLRRAPLSQDFRFAAP